MTDRVFLAITLVAVVTATRADISTDFEVYQPLVVPGSDPLVPDFNDGSYWTIDMVITVYDDDDWTSTFAEAIVVRGARFFEHPLGGDTPPDPDLFDEYPALEWDSHYRSTEESHDPSFAELINEPTYRRATWFDTPLNGGEGAFLVARYTLKATCPHSFTVWAVGSHTGLEGGIVWEFWWPTYPAPPAADTNGDYCVDQADLGILLAAFGSQPDDPNWDCAADIDEDFDVDQSDLGLLLADWGAGCP